MLIFGRVFEFLVDAEAAAGDVVIQVIKIFYDTVAPGWFYLTANCSMEHGRSCASQLGFGFIFEEVNSAHANKINGVKACFNQY